MSDTQRTDKESFFPHDSKYQVCDADFARILECELNAANVEIEEQRKDIVYLATEKAKLEERIKRLEEAGDKAILNSYLPDRLEVWNKAKEAKL